MAAGESDASFVEGRVARPTNADVARLAKVSTATVSYVLNKTEGRQISKRTQEAVRRAAEQLGYRPNMAARNLARRSGGVVLYVVPRVAVGEMPIKAGSRMTAELARLGLLQVQIFETEDDQQIVAAIGDLDPVAVISMFPLTGSVGDAVVAAGVPKVEIGMLPALGDPLRSVGALRVGHLIERGHRRLAFAYSGITKWRALGDFWHEGVAWAARAHGLAPVVVADVLPETVAQVVSEWVGAGVSAVCAQSDEVAALVLYGIRAAGLRCPEDLAVIGVDANPMGAFSDPPLTTVEFDPDAVATVALAAVLGELGYPVPTAAESTAVARLVVRAST